MIITCSWKNCVTLLVNKFLQFKRHPLYFIYHKCSYRYKNNVLYTPDFPQVNCFFSTSVLVNNVHTTKNWKIIARTGQKKDELPDEDKSPISCEEGSDTIHHTVLLNQLQNCKTVSDQIETFCSLMSITQEDIEKRKQFCNSLAKDFGPYFSKLRVHQFGSSINGLGFKGCDIDVSIQTIFDGQEYLKDVKNVPTLDSVIQGDTSADTMARLPSLILLRFIRRVIRQHCPDVKEPILLIKARCPILRFYNAKYDVYCDFSYENVFSLRNTKLIRLISLFDKRFKILAQIIRYWGKYGGFVGDIDLFNSYAFSILVIHFLQQTQPPVLPPISELIEKSEYLINGEVNDEELMLKDLKKFQPSKNSQCIEELLRDFFFYYLNFDYSNVILPLSSSIMPKTSFNPCATNNRDVFEFSPVTVQDPFRLNFNVTHGATYKACRKFLNGLVEACKLYQDETHWNPSSEMWGICSLFHKPMSEQESMKNWQENPIETIKLPLKSDSSTVKKILMECLLFDCLELFVDEDSLTQNPSLRLKCKVYHKTWLGRDWIHRKCPDSLTNIIKRENWISKGVLQSREKETKQLLFTFLCECYENTSENELKIVLSFKDSKCSPIVAIYLKDYLAHVYKKLNI